MAIIKKKIENLKPGKEYVLTVRAKNSDLNVLSDYSDTIRFQVPNDTTTPSALTNLQLFAGLENVMFVFDYSEDLDIRKYEYELYQNSDMSDETGPRTGFADANIFTVSVDNLQSEEDGGGLARFWGRARAIDTTGNAGPWTSLVETDDRIPVIDNQYIGSLTASKITAGTISSHTITLNSASSIIKSSNFNGTPVGDGSYSNATTGWLINGQGKAYFYDATVVGSIDIGGFDSGSFHVNTYGDMWLGAGTYDAAPFRVYRNGKLEIGAGTGSTIGGQFIDTIAETVIDFNGRNNRNSTAVTAPTLPSPVTVGNLVIGASYTIVSAGTTSFTSIGAANNTVGTVFTATGVGAGTGTVSGETIDHTLNTDGSANISFEWNYTYSSADNAANNIDGFYVHIYSSDSSSPYVIGTTPNLESTYPVDYLKRSIVFSGLPADKYYTFGVKAFRVVDKDIATSGIKYSSIVQSSVTQENPYRPSTTVAFAGNITGTVNSVAVATITTGISNFNNNNDQKTTTPATPTSVAFSTATSNTNASIDLPLSWTFTGSGDAYDVDGFVVFLRTTTATDATSITTSDLNTNIQQVYLTAEKRSHTFSGISPSSFHKAAVRAYRVVDTNVNSAGILYGPLANTTERSSAIATIGGSFGIKIGDGSIYIGTGNYGSPDTGFYVDSTGKFSLKNQLTWNGTDTLSVTGTINATSGTFTSTVIVGGATSGTLQVGTGTNKIKIVGTSADAGTYINTGSTTATTGNGFYFGADGKVRIASSTNSLTFDGTNLTINGGGTFTGALSGGTISIGLGNNIFKADSNGIYLGHGTTFLSAPFRVTPAGEMTATSGVLGGWNIGTVNQNDSGALSGALYSGSGSSLSAIAPGGWAWFSSRIITPLISGYGSGTSSSGGGLQGMFIRNIQYGGTKPGSPAVGDIYFS